MPDMLVNLLNLPEMSPAVAALRDSGVIVRRAHPFELTPVRTFIAETLAVTWADEVIVVFANKPGSVYIAIRDGAVIGFAAYECTRRAFFGPTGVAESERGKGIGSALLLACMHGLREAGYVYGIIGGAGPTDFYAKTIGAVPIAGSSPGIYVDMLKS